MIRPLRSIATCGPQREERKPIIRLIALLLTVLTGFTGLVYEVA